MAEALEQKKYYTREEYLASEEKSEYKSEYYNGEIFSMAGGSRNHSVICVNLNWRLGEALADKDCIVFDSNMKLHIVKTHAVVYPDLMVVCGKEEFIENRNDLITNPIVIIEVLSPSTQTFDRGKKFEYYRTVSSLKEYLLIFQDKPMVESFYKQNEKTWLYTIAEGPEDTIALQTLGYTLMLKDIYQKVEWEYE